jgi:hypothetical protein
MPDNETKSWLERFAALSSLFGVVAAFFYVVLRTAYGQFYAAVGLEPEDVGLGRNELLAQAITGPVVYIIVYSGFAFGVAWLIFEVCARRPISLRIVAGFAAVVVAGTLVLTIVALFVDAHRLSVHIVDGEAARHSYLRLGWIQIPMLQIWAIPVDIEWIGTDPMPDTLVDTSCMFYLGEANDVGVLYDVRNQHALRFPRKSVVLITSREPKFLPPQCTS